MFIAGCRKDIHVCTGISILISVYTVLIIEDARCDLLSGEELILEKVGNNKILNKSHELMAACKNRNFFKKKKIVTGSHFNYFFFFPPIYLSE